MIHDLMLIGLSVSLAVTLVLYVFRTRGLQESNAYLAEQNIELVDRAILGEREAVSARTELNFLKQSVVVMLQRPQVVVMTEEQFGILTNTVSQAVQAIVKPNSLN